MVPLVASELKPLFHLGFIGLLTVFLNIAFCHWKTIVISIVDMMQFVGLFGSCYVLSSITVANYVVD